MVAGFTAGWIEKKDYRHAFYMGAVSYTHLDVYKRQGNSRKMRELTAKRAVAAMPVAGSYRAIDFVLSNMTNSHIQKVAVLTQYNARSLNEHLNSSKWWDFGRKQGGLFVFTPTITADNGYWYRGTADAIYQNLDFLKKCHEPYAVSYTHLVRTPASVHNIVNF